MTDRTRPRRPGATIEEVARAAGVSRQTVSNALNAPHRVRADTLARVNAAIKTLGYRPDQSARSLRTGERRALGYLAPADDPFNPNPLMGGFLEALVDAAGADGVRVLLFRPAAAGDPRAALDEVIAARQVDGFVLSDVLTADPRVDHLAGAGVPFATFGRTAPDAPQHWVDIDNAAGVADVVAHLAGLGHRRVAYVGTRAGAGTPAELPWLVARRAGYEQGVAAHGLDASPALQPVLPPGSPGDDPAETVRVVRDLLRDPAARPTAVAAETDTLALAVYEAIRSEGLRVGTDVAVVGFTDAPLCRLLHPQLASVRLPLRAIATALVGMLLAQVRGEGGPGVGLELATELVVRDSAR